MKVDPNAPAYPFVLYSHNPDGGFGSASSPGIPIRLAIAAQIMAALATDPALNGIRLTPHDRGRTALAWADALIAAHNEGTK